MTIFAGWARPCTVMVTRVGVAGSLAASVWNDPRTPNINSATAFRRRFRVTPIRASMTCVANITDNLSDRLDHHVRTIVLDVMSAVLDAAVRTARRQGG